MAARWTRPRSDLRIWHQCPFPRFRCRPRAPLDSDRHSCHRRRRALLGLAKASWRRGSPHRRPRTPSRPSLRPRRRCLHHYHLRHPTAGDSPPRARPPPPSQRVGHPRPRPRMTNRTAADRRRRCHPGRHRRQLIHGPEDTSPMERGRPIPPEDSGPPSSYPSAWCGLRGRRGLGARRSGMKTFALARRSSPRTTPRPSPIDRRTSGRVDSSRRSIPSDGRPRARACLWK
mmetsp:Transcript_37596/g.90656  ORF Transcript_37596/g.90656 Transcript_37596/m.90656 type:complete len:230 (-) Transcript_37596:178-867(-)